VSETVLAPPPNRLLSSLGPSVPMLDFSRQFAGLRDEVMAAIDAVCGSQRFILGPQVESFERKAALACGAPHAIGCASGTDALWLALAAGNIGEIAGAHDHAVVTSPFSFFASASSIVRAGARPVFADIDPLTFNLSPDSVSEVLKRTPGKVKAILPVHLFGQCADWDAFTAIQRLNSELLLIEDAAQAFGATWNSIPVGSLGDAAAFSFYPTKNLSAFGDAGLMTTRSSAMDEHARSLRAHGMRRRYFHDEMGWNSRLDTLQAAVLEVKLKYIAGWNQQRRELAARYQQLFLAAGIAFIPSAEKPGSMADGVILPFTHPRAQHVFHQYVVRAPQRDELRAYLAERGIGSEVYYPLSLHQQAALEYLGYRTGDFPESERAAAEVLALPMYPELRHDEQDVVVEAIRSFYAGC
jgi:dTDP-4-amino-4,6-dideoxygalactose transaminase